MSENNKHKGGIARAEKLTPEQRSEIAKKAAGERWKGDIEVAKYAGVITVGEVEIPCAVLANGTRLISETAVVKALGGTRSGSHWKRKKNPDHGADLPLYVSSGNIKPFVSNELEEALVSKIKYRTAKGSAIGFGLEASLLPQVCDVWLKARDAGKVLKSQQKMALAADMLMRGLAKVGIIALIDEATGYQYDRDRDSLQKLLSLYLSEEKLKWAKMFPDEYYRQLFRLKGWEYSPITTKRNHYVGKLTNQIVYEKLPPKVIDELRRLNPVVGKKGKRIARHHQFLTEDIGQKDLREHLLQLIAIMRISDSWETFIIHFNKAFPDKKWEEMDKLLGN